MCHNHMFLSRLRLQLVFAVDAGEPNVRTSGLFARCRISPVLLPDPKVVFTESRLDGFDKPFEPGCLISSELKM